MKDVYLWLTFISIVFFSCTEEKIMTYDADDYLQFSRSAIDSSICSFLIYPDINEVQFPINVEIVGFPAQKDRIYKMAVVPELTDAGETTYHIPPEFVFRANMIKDTCRIILKKTPDLSVKPARLALKLVETDDFKVGQTEFSLSIISVTNVMAKPAWWTNMVTSYYLGDYSDKKYRLFITATGKAEIDSDNEEELRYNTLLLKYYLQREKDAGRTVYEENGTEMTVNLITG